MLISPDVDLTLFVTFITTCKTSPMKIWFVLAAGLAENLTQVVFRQPFVIQHVRTRLLRCETWNFLFFIFSLPYNLLVIFDVIVFPLAAFVLFCDLNCKNAWLNHTIPYGISKSSSWDWKKSFVLGLVFYVSDVIMGVCFHDFLANCTCPWAPTQWAIFWLVFFWKLRCDPRL